MDSNLLVLTLEESGKLFVSAVPIGFVIGCIPMIVGFAIHGLVKIFKMI